MKHRNTLRAFLVFLCASVLLFLLCFLLYDSYRTYEETTLAQARDNLQLVASITANSLDQYITGEADKLGILCQTPRFIQEWERFYREGEAVGLKEYILYYASMLDSNLYRIALVDNRDNVVFEHNIQSVIAPDSYPPHEVLTRQSAGWLATYPVSDNHYVIAILDTVFSGDVYLGTVVTVWDLQNMYNELLVPVPLGERSYLMVTDRTGTVIMHPDRRRMGVNLFTDPLLEGQPFREETLAVTRAAYESKRGSAKFQSRWWQDEGHPPVTKLLAYARIEAGNNFWVVSIVTDAWEIRELVVANLAKLTAITLSILLVLVVAVAFILQMRRRQLVLERETLHLQRHNEMLEEVQRSQEQLRHYQKLETLGTFANGIAHEFNNLLTPIIGLSAMVEEDAALQGHPELQEDIKTIYQTGLRARELVTQINSFGRRQEVDRGAYTPLRVDQFFQDALRLLRAGVPAGVTVEELLCHGDACVMGNATQLQQVLLNLCSNACQAMGDGGVLTLETRIVGREALPAAHRPPVADRYLELAVADTGKGIPPEILSRVFDPYFTTKDSGKGTGLGLSLAQNIVLDHDGLIAVESRAGEGSRFSVYLPLYREEPGGSRILVVDDDSNILHMVTRAAQKAGFSAEVYSDPLAAEARFKAAPGDFGLVITDYAMPGCNGGELCARLRAARRDIPVLLITGYTRAELQIKAGSFRDVLFKPLEFDKLRQTIQELMPPGGATSGGQT